jgi:hypothetical protein
MLKFFVCVVLAGLLVGCDIYDDLTSSSEGKPGAETESEAAGGDQLEWNNISWKTARGPSAKGATQVMTLDANITSDGRFIQFGWDRYPWGGSSGLGHFFVWDGTRWVGGKFEWIRGGGQALKTTTNIKNGYNGLSAPARGTRVAFAWTNEKGTERSNLVETTWK